MRTENTYVINAKEFIDQPVGILPGKSVMVGNVPLWNLRELKEVVIPEGVTMIGDHWFS